MREGKREEKKNIIEIVGKGSKSPLTLLAETIF